MLVFPNAKINLGLNILDKRPDGYHNLSSVFYPINIHDSLELLISDGTGEVNLYVDGVELSDEKEANFVYQVICQFGLQTKNYEVHLIKNIPMGGGLGGGSSDATFTLKILRGLGALKEPNKIFDNAMSIGSDCGFFVSNETSLVQGRGELVQPISVDLTGYYILLVIPNFHVSTKSAFEHIVPENKPNFKEIITQLPIQEWRGVIKNDFEKTVFEAHPILGGIKQNLYNKGALYAQMSGTGSTIFGIFSDLKKAKIANLSLGGELLKL